MESSRESPENTKTELLELQPLQMPKSPPDIGRTALNPAHPNQSAIHKTIAITELLEQILSNLSIFELCRARRASRIFRNTIDYSLLLQRDLFLEPHTRSLQEAGEDSVAADSSASTHPLIARAGPNLKSKPESEFETDLYLEGRFAEPGGYSVLRNLHQLTQTYGDISGLADDSILHNMFLTNPPVKQVEIQIWHLEGGNLTQSWKSAARSYGLDVLTSGKGVTFGHVFEYTREIFRGRQDGSSVLQDLAPPY